MIIARKSSDEGERKHQQEKIDNTNFLSDGPELRCS